jgi:hypothetical protein
VEKMDMKHKMGSSTHSSEKYPNKLQRVEMVWLAVIENMEEGYGGLFLGNCASSGRKI